MNKNIFKTTKAPSIIWRLPLTPTEKIVLFNLAYFEKDGIIEDKSQSLIAYIIGTTQPTIVRCMSNLEKDGWISRRKAFAKSSSYSISWNKISGYCKNSDLVEDISNCEIEQNTAHLNPSNTEDIPTHQQVEEKPTEVIKTDIKEEIPSEDIKINITEKEIKEVMGTYKGTIEELNKRTITNDFTFIDRLIPKMNLEMALKQIKPYHSKEKNISRLNDALSVFLKDISLDDKAKYYDFLLEQSFAVA